MTTIKQTTGFLGVAEDANNREDHKKQTPRTDLGFPANYELVADWNSTIKMTVNRLTERERAFNFITPLIFTSNSFLPSRC